MCIYYRPIVQSDRCRPNSAFSIAAGWTWFEWAEKLQRGRKPQVVAAADIPADVLTKITSPRPSFAGLDMDQPRLLGILNTTPDSFSDGGLYDDPKAALQRAMDMAAAGADFIDIGGESTRPGANPVPQADEISRTEPIIHALHAQSSVPLSIDTRKASVARQALLAGAAIVNDISALTFDPEMAQVVADQDAYICLMHAQGDPATMQKNPIYENVLLDVFDTLSDRIEFAISQGIPRSRIVVDPGIGFGKTVDHIQELIRNVSIFHGLGCAVLIGTSRKRFIDRLAGVPDVQARGPGSIATSLYAVTQGVQISRVHDIPEMRQALTLWQASSGMGR